MPRFAPDFTQVSAGMKIFPRGDYELSVTGVKPLAYYKTDDDGEPTDDFVAGCQVNIEMVGKIGNDGQLDREDAGESVVPIRLYVHTEKAWGMTKGSIMALLGYTREEEEQFNADFADADFAVEGEGDEAELGDSWNRLVGQHVTAQLSKRMFRKREQLYTSRHNRPTYWARNPRSVSPGAQ